MTESLPNFAPLLQRGRYRLIIELAQGGMSSVYLAVAQGPAGFSKMSVIKELKPSLLEEEGFLDMFLDEARLSARLSHPNVVQTNEVSVEGGRAFLAMEYLDGQSLLRVRSRLGRAGTLPIGPHVRILADACAGLHYAHELRDLDGVALQVVHRDVSPHNVFVTYDGQVKLVDFGVAKAVSQAHETHVGVVKGKLPYMAPEQARAESVDRRADIFAVGVLLWEAAAGRRMWTGQRTETILGRLLANDIPSLAEAAPDVDPRLASIVARATAPTPEARYPTAELLRRDLEAWLAERRDGDYEALRELGEEMRRAFTAERQAISEAVNQQLRLLREVSLRGGSARFELLRLNDPSATGSHPTVSPSQSAPLPLPPISGLPQATGSISGIDSHASQLNAGSHVNASMVVPTSPALYLPPPPPRKGVAVAVTAGVFIMVAALGAGLVVSRRYGQSGGVDVSSSSTADTTAPVDSASNSVPADGPAEMPEAVRVHVRANPPNTRLYLDGAALGTNPHVASFRRDGVTHRIRAEAPGYVTKTELVTFDHEVDLSIALDRVIVAPPPRVKPTRPEASERPDPPPTKSGRTQRPIDTDLEPR